MFDNLTTKKIANFTIITIGVGWILFIGASLIQPIIFALLFAVFLIPVTKFFGRWLKIKWLQIILAFLTVLLPIALIAVLFTSQLSAMMDEMPSLSKQFNEGMASVSETIKKIVPIKNFNPTKFFKDNIGSISDGPVSALGQGIVSTSGILLSIALSFLYTFFLLYYKKSIKNFILYQFARYKRQDISDTLLTIKETVQSYVGGLGIVMIILTVLNSLGLFIIGIEYAIFWGALAGILAIIPYVGTFLGGLFPFLYSLTNSEHSWQPIAVLIYYLVIQQLEGNFITPKVVGDKVNINPFVAILSIVFFGSFWGIGGVILALPLISVIRIIMDQFEETKGVAMLMSSDISDADEFEKIHNHSHNNPGVHILTKEDIINNPEDEELPSFDR